MIKVLINRKRLLDSFEYDSSVYKGIRIGDVIRIPSDQSLSFGASLYVIVTEFNRVEGIVHWKCRTKFDGIIHSGTYYDEIEQHIRLTGF